MRSLPSLSPVCFGLAVATALPLFSGAAQAQTATPTPTSVFFDDFSAGKLDSSRWGVENEYFHLNRTQFGGTPTFGRDADSTTWMRIPLATYNPKNPGKEVRGTEVYSLSKWNLNAGVEWEARLRFPVSTPGWVGGYFSYNGTGFYPDTYQQAECDFEFLTNQTGDKIWTNIWDDWNPLRGGARGDMLSSLPGFNWKDGKWHTFKIRWEPTKTTWFADGQVLRTETAVQPGGAQGVRFNAWLADPGWPQASNPALVPASTPDKNQNIYYDIDSISVRALPNPTVGPYGTGTGLTGTYFNSADFSSPKVTRVDSRINFDWGLLAPDAALRTDNFTVRWEGMVQARFNETYTFYTTSDDGARLWVNGVQLLNVWQDGGPNNRSGTIALKAGQRYSIRLEYYDNLQQASMRLRWSSPSTPLQIVPQSQLYPQGAPLASVATPQFSPPAGTYSSAQSVAITSSTPGATIRYTLNGSTPTESSPILATGQKIQATNTVITARAFAPGASPSAVATATYKVSIPLSVSIAAPIANATIANFSNLSGTAPGASRVEVEIKRLRDGKFWNGWEWLTTQTAVPAQLLNGSWKVVAPASNGAGLPSGTNLSDGTYLIEADAYDAAGRIVIATRNTTISKTASITTTRSAGTS